MTDEVLYAKLDQILTNQVRILARLGETPPIDPVVPKPLEPKPAEPKPVEPKDNPFVELKALGVNDLTMWVIMFNGGRALTPEQEQQAVDAGYVINRSSGAGESHDTSVRDFQWRSGSHVDLRLQAGEVGSVRLSIPVGYVGRIQLNASQGPAMGATELEAWVDSGPRQRLTMGGVGGQTHSLRCPEDIAPGEHTYSVRLIDGPGWIKAQLQHD